jgi:HTH-type transcriptional regulator/antitoxin HigA
MQIRPIRTSKNHRAALAEIEKLWGASTGTPEGDKLDILVTLVETYEERRWPLRSRRRFDPVDVLRYAIEELGHSQADLADILGSRSRASEVLALRRALCVGCRLPIPATVHRNHRPERLYHPPSSMFGGRCMPASVSP